MIVKPHVDWFALAPVLSLLGASGLLLMVAVFTRRTIRDLFEACGYGVESVSTVVFPTSPAGAQTLAFLRTFPNASDDLTAAEFLVTATADS